MPSRKSPSPRSKSRIKPSIKTATKTKKQMIMSMLGRKGGASVDEICKATDWQAHSVRGFLSGTVGKAMGHTLAIATDKKGVRRYALKM